MKRRDQFFMLFAVITLLTAIFLASCSSNKHPSEAPRGYPNEILLKAAIGTKLEKIIDTKPEIPTDIEVVSDIEYKKVGDVSLQLDIYRQKDTPKDAPLLLFIHGGSWSKGKRSDYLIYLLHFAKKGYVTATVTYRLVKTARYPAAVQDVKCAIKHLKKNGEKYGYDPKRIALIGGSAGGHLAMMAGFEPGPDSLTECQDTISGEVQAIVNFYGPVDLTTPYARARPEVTNFLNTSHEQQPELFTEASPRKYISGKVPPTLTFHGTIDSLVPVSQADSLDNWMKKAGAVHEYHRLEGWPHAMDLSVKVNTYCRYHIEQFLAKHL